MKKGLLNVLLVVVISMLALTGCGNSGDGKDNTSPAVNPSSVVSESSPANNENTSEKKDNLQAVLDLMKSANQETHFYKTEKYGQFLGQCIVQYKKDIKNPYNGGTDIYTIDRDDRELKNKDIAFTNNSASIIAIADGFVTLSNYDKSTIVYGCNEKNKGMVMGIAFVDGFYLYEIDEKGNKTNETTYMFSEIK